MNQSDYALVVGISRYPAPEFAPLKGPELDAQDFHNWVVDPTGGAVPPAQARKIVSSMFRRPSKSPSTARPTADEIDRFFLQLEDVAKKNEARGDGLTVGRRLYIFLSGHGFAPSKDEAALLAANSSPSRLKYHIPGKAWADNFYQSLWFEEILLFMDCCRNFLPGAIPNPPGFKAPPHPNFALEGKRLFGFATGSGRLARERDYGAETRGVFTKALMAGLRGAASDPATGDITATSLRNYLINNMRGFLDPADLANPDIPKEPAIEPSTAEAGPDFVIAKVPVRKFPVEIKPPPNSAGLAINVHDGIWRDGGFPILATEVSTAAAWRLDLPVGNYFVQVVGGPPLKAFSVTAGGAITHVDFN